MRPWSFSALMVFEKCPLHYKFKYLDKLPDNSPKEALERGSRIHTYAENFVKGETNFAEELNKFEREFVKLKEHYEKGLVTVEEEWAFDENWKTTDWKNGWLRLKCDAVYHASPKKLTIIDYKTGRKSGNEVKHARQLELYALAGLLRYPDSEQITCELWYLDANESTKIVHWNSKTEKLLTTWNKAGKRISEATFFPAKPNDFTCKWCPYKEQCELNEFKPSIKQNEDKLATFKKRF